MKKVLICLMSVMIALTFALTGCTKSIEKTRSDSEKFAARSYQMFERAYKDYFSETGKFAHVHFPYTVENDKVAGDWHVVALLQAGLQVQKLYPNDKFVINANKNLYEAMDYFVEARDDGYLAYGVERGMFPGTAPVKTAFDDNIHIARVYMEGYTITGDKTYLEKAKKLIEFVVDLAWHTEINSSTGEEIGGLGWGEGDVLNALFTCTNAPAAAMCAEMYHFAETEAEKKYYLDWAIKIYDFTVEYLRFNNGVYSDGRSCMALNDGTYVITDIAGTAHTYNNGFPISAGIELYNITKDEKYLNDAKFTADASFIEFADGSIVDGLYQYPQKYYEAGNWFNQMLFEGYMAIDRVAQTDNTKKYVKSFSDGINYAYENYYKNGYLPTNYISGWIASSFEDGKKAILSTAADITIMAKMALYMK